MKKFLIACVFASMFNIADASNHATDNQASRIEITAAETDVKVGDYIAASTRDDDYISITVYSTKTNDGYYAMANGVKYTVYKNPNYKQNAKNNPRTSCTHYIQHDMWKYYFSI